MKNELIVEPQNQSLEENKKLKVSVQTRPVPGPGCRVHFNGCLQGSIRERQAYHVTNPFLTHDFGKAMGETIGGDEFDSYDGSINKNLSQLAPNATYRTFDSIMVDTTTRVTIYSAANSEKIEFDAIGPFVLNNTKWGFRPSWSNGQGDYKDEFGEEIDNFWKKYGFRSQAHFNAASLYSNTDMHGWPNGRITIDCTPQNDGSRLGRNENGELVEPPNDYCYKYENGQWVPTNCYDDDGVLIPGSEIGDSDNQIGPVDPPEDQPDPENIVRYGITNR